MLAYNLILSIVPLALLTLFIAGQVLQSGDVEQSVLGDLQRLFPDAARSTLTMWMRFWKLDTRSALAKRAVPPVGSTWFTPAT